MRTRGLYGIDYSFSRDIAVDDLFHREKIVEASHLATMLENLERHGITLIRGHASFEDAHTLRVRAADGSTSRVRGEYVLIATGSRPSRPDEIPFDGECVYDTDSILRLARLPGSMVIIGAGVIGSEYATLFAALGTRVTLVDGRERLLPFLDQELAGILTEHMRAHGVVVRFGRRIDEIRRTAEGVITTLDDGSEIEADTALFCGGRLGNTDGLALEEAGVAIGASGRITVNEHYRTSVANVLAAGDVIGFPALASTSMEQARVAVCQAFGFAYKRQMSSLIPYGLYTIPEVSMVGASEDALLAAGTRFLVGRAHLARNARAQIAGDTAGLIKLLFDPETRAVLGVHIIGERASELIHVGQMAMQLGGTIDVFIDNVFNFPTLADAYKYAAYDGLQALERYERERDGVRTEAAT
jgi:NAD(P) transhydrogenase